MIEEYDRTSTSLSNPSRLCFCSCRSPIGIVNGSPKSKAWFIDALNGTGIFSMRFSVESASVKCLLGFDDVVHLDSFASVEAQIESLIKSKEIARSEAAAAGAMVSLSCWGLKQGKSRES
ncbi:hypothetical protein HHK36_016039 [Tetracentron sinense]|uniref:Uncharacterized protein n=1 Tax=Tetracentron sinense TaxID=13715 RepID=A0A834Z502_TETSI|nr:hypothetical protein HHK36_016039 [Tetracentron sinense]